MLLTDRQTDKTTDVQTNKCYRKHNLRKGDKSNPSLLRLQVPVHEIPAGKLMSYQYMAT